MKLNASKTKTMIVSRSRTSVPQHPDLQVGGVNLINSPTLEVLGVEFDRKLTFESHVRTLASRAARSLGIVRKAYRFSVTTLFLKVFPFFFCCPSWSIVHLRGVQLVNRISRF